MDKHDPPVQIVGISFGEMIPDPPSILVGFRVRTIENGLEVEGSRDAVILGYEVLATVRDFWPTLLEMMTDQGATQDVLPPAFGPVPHWNSGPTLKEAGSRLFICTTLAYREVIAESGAVVMYLEAVSPGQAPGGAVGADYLIAFRELREFNENLAKVLRKLEQKGFDKWSKP